MNKTLIIFKLATCLFSAGLGSTFAPTALADGPATKPAVVVCGLYYRPRTSDIGGEGVNVGRKLSVEIAVPPAGSDAKGSTKRIKLPADDPQFTVELMAKANRLIVRFDNAETMRPIAATSFTIDEKTKNQFAGGHGFTGLTYVSHPDGPAEVQFWASLK